MVSTRRRGSGAGGGLRIRKKARGFMCGCGGTKAVSISDGASDKQSPLATPPTAVSSTPTTTTTTTTTSRVARRAGSKMAEAAPSSFSPSSSYYAGQDSTDDAHSSGVEGTPSLSTLLRQLRDLERSVRFLHSSTQEPKATGATGGADNDVDAAAAASNTSSSGSNSDECRRRRHRRTGSAGRVEESVAVVKESADPLGDFRRSMLQMIVEKEIVGGAELRELLRRFLALNAPQHHHLILQAFAEIWEEVFAGYDDERTPDELASSGSQSQSHHRRRRGNKAAVRA